MVVRDPGRGYLGQNAGSLNCVLNSRIRRGAEASTKEIIDHVKTTGLLEFPNALGHAANGAEAAQGQNPDFIRGQLVMVVGVHKLAKVGTVVGVYVDYAVVVGAD